MPVEELISEEELRLALRPHRVDPEKFEGAVRERMKGRGEAEYDPLATMSPLLKTAASLLPFEVLAEVQATRTAAASAPIAGAFSKILGYAAFPAISLFVLLGSALFSVMKIRRIQTARGSAPAGGPANEEAVRASINRWWQSHRWGGWGLFAVTLALSVFGATSLLFLGYIVSTLILLYILKSFARVGIGNRLVVGQSCMVGLLLLAQMAGIPQLFNFDIQLVDRSLLVPLFFVGAMVVSLVSTGVGRRLPVLRIGVLVVAASWFMSPILRPATPARIRAWVESFDRAEFSNASWRQWEIVASWAVNAEPAPDLSRPRRLLAEEIAGEQNPAILSSAFHIGLVRADQVPELKDYQRKLHDLLDEPTVSRFPQQLEVISPLDFNDWVIRAAVLRDELMPQQRDFLEKRLHATLKWSLTRTTPRTLNEPLRATRLLAVIGRPVNPAQYQEAIHEMLRRFHTRTGIGLAGGFKSYDTETIRAADLNSTVDAIELMEIYGIPKDLDVNWVRSALRPSAYQIGPDGWIIAVARDRMNHLPGTGLSWFELLYYGRSVVAAFVLIGLCIYATAVSPRGLESRL